jgi:hypothetical protein
MRHIDTFTLGRFRGIRDVTLEGLGQINLLVGNNHSGKTSVLEAFSLYSSPLNERRWRQIANSREVSTDAPSSVATLRLVDRLLWLFFQQESATNISPEVPPALLLAAPGFLPLKEMSAYYRKYQAIGQARYTVPGRGVDVQVEHMQIEVSVTLGPLTTPDQPALFDRNEHQKKLLDFSENSHLSLDAHGHFIATQLLSPFSHRLSGLQPHLWSRVVTAELKDSTLELLRSYDPKIQDIDLVLLQNVDALRSGERRNRVVLSVKHQQLGRAPLSTFGDGLRRIFTLAAAIPQCRDGLLLIDELETSIHTQALRSTFAWLVNACRENNVQLFATTHSLETIDAVIDACKDDAIDLVVYRLEQGETHTKATRFDKRLVTRLREELSLEVR